MPSQYLNKVLNWSSSDSFMISFSLLMLLQLHFTVQLDSLSCSSSNKQLSHTFPFALPLCSYNNFSPHHQHSVQKQLPLQSLLPHILPSYHNTTYTQRKSGFSLTHQYIMRAPITVFSTGSITVYFLVSPTRLWMPLGRVFLTFESLPLVGNAYNSSLIGIVWISVLTRT